MAMTRPADEPIDAIPAPAAATGAGPRADLVVGVLALLLAGLLAVWLLPSYVRTPIAPRPLAMAPWFLPAVTTGLIGLAGVMLLARARRDRPAERGESARPARGLIAALAILVLYPILMPWLGALVTGIVLTCALLLLAGALPSRLAIVGLAVPFIAWLLFAEAIGIPLPRGFLL